MEDRCERDARSLVWPLACGVATRMSENVNEPILIWGAGAIGGLLGAYWARAGHEVLLVDINEEHVAACNTQGLRIEGPVAQFRQPVKAVIPQQVSGQWRHVVLAVKAQHTLSAVRSLMPHLADDGYILSAQNGLNEHLIANEVGAQRVIGAFVNFGADWLGPGQLLYGNRGAVVVGEIDGSAQPRTRALHALLAEFEPEAILTEDIWSYLWGKMGYGAMLFATALTHESMSENFSDPERAPVLIALAREVMQVARAEGVTPRGFNGYDPEAFSPEASAETAQQCINQLAEFTSQTAKTHSGIYRDIAVRKRPTEVDPQIVAIADIANKHGVDVPLTNRLIELVRDVETGRRKQSPETFQALRNQPGVST